MTTLIFDFDGTLADSLEAIVEISNRLAPQYGLKPATAAELVQFRDLSADQFIRRSNIPLLKLLRLLRRMRRELQAKVPELDPIEGIEPMLMALHAQGHNMGIVTSNSFGNVQMFLAIHGLESYFQFIQGGVPLFGKGRVLRQLMRQRRLVPSKTLYVGDETRDIDASRRIGLRVVAVSWGFNSRQALERHQPHFLIDSPAQLLEVANTVV